jgi:hypothetical protein
MHLNVKLQGLKYNFGKVQGCFCKIAVLWDFLEFSVLFYYRKICGIGLQPHGPGPWAPAHESTDLIKRRPLATGSMAWIKPSKLLFLDLISIVDLRADD